MADIDVTDTVKSLYDCGVELEQIETLYNALDDYYAGKHPEAHDG